MSLAAAWLYAEVVEHDAAPAPAPVRLRIDRGPGYMRPVAGERDETCGLYADCLLAAARRDWRTCSCPEACAARREPVRQTLEYTSAAEGPRTTTNDAAKHARRSRR